MARICAGMLVTVLLAGCAGHYRLTVPDAVTVPGKAAPVVIRLERQEFGPLYRPLDGAAMRMWIADQPLRAAYTRDKGYASAAVPAPEKPGAYTLTVAHQDRDGGDVGKIGRAFVLAPAARTLVVDWQALGREKDGAWRRRGAGQAGGE